MSEVKQETTTEVTETTEASVPVILSSRARRLGIRGDTLAARRLSLGLSQRDVADRLGVTDRTVSGWENARGPVRCVTAKALASAYGLKEEELRGYYVGNSSAGYSLLTPSLIGGYRKRLTVMPTSPRGPVEPDGLTLTPEEASAVAALLDPSALLELCAAGKLDASQAGLLFKLRARLAD